MHHFDGDRYELGGYVIMPNHVHVTVKPFDQSQSVLSKITHRWKSFSSHKISQLRTSQKTFWQNESYDRIIRDEEHLWRAIQEIGRNPIKAKLEASEYDLWFSKIWEAAGWKFQN